MKTKNNFFKEIMLRKFPWSMDFQIERVHKVSNPESEWLEPRFIKVNFRHDKHRENPKILEEKTPVTQRTVE